MERLLFTPWDVHVHTGDEAASTSYISLAHKEVLRLKEEVGREEVEEVWDGVEGLSSLEKQDFVARHKKPTV